jgi:DNA repair exonuclease SbcCD ATPase subunit
MSDSRPTLPKNLAAEFANIGGGSTTDIWKQLFRLAYQVEDMNKAGTTPLYAQMVKLEDLAAELTNKLSQNKNQIRNADMGIQANVNLLNAPRSPTADLVPEFMTKFAPLHQDVQVREKERSSLGEEVKNFIQNYRTTLLEAIQDLTNGQPLSQIKSKLENLERKQIDLSDRVEKLEINEHALHVRTYNAVPLSARTTVPTPGAQTPANAEKYEPE